MDFVIKYQTRIRPRLCTHANAIDEGEQACITMESIAVARLQNSAYIGKRNFFQAVQILRKLGSSLPSSKKLKMKRIRPVGAALWSFEESGPSRITIQSHVEKLKKEYESLHY